ncbi:hypothetical protein [Methylobacterium sp. Leaf118]|nr:hypothetical protein [Methylobacterium sp. Leaf118]
MGQNFGHALVADLDAAVVCQPAQEVELVSVLLGDIDPASLCASIL